METTKTQPDGATRQSAKQKRSKSPDEIYRKIEGSALKLLSSFRERVNKKNFGKTVQDNEIIAFALTLLSDEHIKTLQERSLSNRDRLSMAHEEYCKKHGKITMDEYLGVLLHGETKSK